MKDANGNPPLINRLLAVSSPGETRNTFPGPQRRARIFYKRIILSRHFYGGSDSGMGDVLMRLARTRETIIARSRWELFCDTVKQIAPLSEIGIRLRPHHHVLTTVSAHNERFLSLEDFLNGGEQERLERWGNVDGRAEIQRRINGVMFPLSSGQLTFIRFAAQVCLHIENGTMVLFDEPEIHLHPNYISDFVRLLSSLLSKTGSFAILATHSAYFVREVTRSQVIVLHQAINNQIQVLTPRLRTFGADIGEISHFVFEDQLFGNLVQQVRERLKRDPAQAAKYLSALESELSVEAWMSLNREIPRKERK